MTGCEDVALTRGDDVIKEGVDSAWVVIFELEEETMTRSSSETKALYWLSCSSQIAGIVVHKYIMKHGHHLHGL